MSTRAERRRAERKEDQDIKKTGYKVGRWLLLLVGLVFLGFMLSEVFFPYQGQEYIPISHGDHSHYIPHDRNPDVPISNFPTRPPGPGERLLPNGQIVPEE